MIDTNFAFIDNGRPVSLDAMHNICDGIQEALDAKDNGAVLRMSIYGSMLENICGKGGRFGQLKRALIQGSRTHARRQLVHIRAGLTPRKPIIYVQTRA